MSMSTHVIGLRSKEDLKYKAMCIAYKALVDAELEIPEELENYFEDEYPEGPLKVRIPCTNNNDIEMSDCYEIKVADIPEGVETIRFVNSY